MKSKNVQQDASWVVNKARSCVQEGDSYSAKAWLLTGKTLFPGNFAIQYEDYMMEKKAGEIKRCGKLFYDMMVVFSKEDLLWEELSRIFHLQDSLRQQNAETKFSKDMFGSLTENQQKELLLKYANHQTDIIDKCKISLLVLKRFKGAVCDQAINLITTLKSAEDKEFPKNPLNIYRKMIVCDILPLILKSSDIKVGAQTPKRKKKSLSFVSEEQLIYYLNLTMEFLVLYVIHRHSLYETSCDLHVLDLEEKMSCWNVLHEHLILHATKLEWNNLLKIKDKIDPSKNRTLKSRCKVLSHARESKASISIFYGILQLYMFTILRYSSEILSSESTSNGSISGENENEYILVEHIDHMTQKDRSHQSVIRVPKKKKKTDDSASHSSDHQSGSEEIPVILHPGLIGHVNQSLGEFLPVAIETRHILKSYYYAEFEQIMSDWGAENWNWMKRFQTDSLLYQGKFKLTMESINSAALSQNGEPIYTMKQKLQLASAHFCAGQRMAAVEKALSALSNLSASSFGENGNSAGDVNLTKPDGRSLLLLSTSPSDILTYIVQIVFGALKSRLYADGPQRDNIIGHLIILTQLKWELNEQLFLHLLKLIEAQDGGFQYDLFFTYVTNIDILEEFAYLQSLQTIKLDLMPSNSSNKKNITRGVNREADFDFRSSILRQVQRSHEPIKKTIFAFLTNEKDSIIEALK